MTHSHTPGPRVWLWPDRTIGKRESRALREEHNEAINQRAELLEALEELLLASDLPFGSQEYPDAVDIARAAIAKATYEKEQVKK